MVEYEEMQCAKDIESMGLLGDKSVELFFRNNTVKVKISTFDHLLEHIVVSQFSQVLGNLTEILQSNESFITSQVPVFCASKVMKTL